MLLGSLAASDRAASHALGCLAPRCQGHRCQAPGAGMLRLGVQVGLSGLVMDGNGKCIYGICMYGICVWYMCVIHVWYMYGI